MTELLDEIIIRSRGLIFDMKEQNKMPKKITVHISKIDKFMLDGEIKCLPHNLVNKKIDPIPPNSIFGVPLDFVVDDIPCMTISIV